MKFRSASPVETQELARCLGELAPPGTLLVLDGPLGAGKTSFAQGLAKGLGIEGVVNSPTFTLVKEYCGRLPLFHFDLYRLEEAEELWELGFEEYLRAGGVCALEWGERAIKLLPAEYMHIHLDYDGENQRIIHILPVGEKHSLLAKELKRHVNTGN